MYWTVPATLVPSGPISVEDLHSAGWEVAVPSLIWPRRWSVDASRSKRGGSLSQARDFEKSRGHGIVQSSFETSSKCNIKSLQPGFPWIYIMILTTFGFRHSNMGNLSTKMGIDVGLQLENHQHLDFSHFQHGTQPGVARMSSCWSTKIGIWRSLHFLKDQDDMDLIFKMIVRQVCC